MRILEFVGIGILCRQQRDSKKTRDNDPSFIIVNFFVLRSGNTRYKRMSYLYFLSIHYIVCIFISD